MSKDIQLNPCPKCNGNIRLMVRYDIGAYAKCDNCKEEQTLCNIDELKIYDGYKIRNSTVNKIKRLWNKQTK